MNLDEARELVNGPLWPKVRDKFLATGEFVVYPKGDLRRFEYLDGELCAEIDRWMEGVLHLGVWRRVLDGKEVRRLKNEFPGVYPEILRYEAYFAGKKNPREVLLKLKFPEAYKLVVA